MAELVEALVARLPAGSVQCGAGVSRLGRLPEGRWELYLSGPRRETMTADAVILATPARATARLLEGVDPKLAALVGGIESAGCAVISLGYRCDRVGHSMDGFGFVVPLVEGRSILSGSFASRKFPGRSPDDCVLIRAFLGGAGRPDLLELPDDALVDTAHRELARLLRIRGGPLLRHLERWPGVMPQYHVGHLDLVRSIEGRAADIPGLALAGNAYRGVGVPHCIRSGEQAAERIAAGLVGPAAAVAIRTSRP
jgi:oxygen-dependent protoporphyrinogen oxidase